MTEANGAIVRIRTMRCPCPGQRQRLKPLIADTGLSSTVSLLTEPLSPTVLADAEAHQQMVDQFDTSGNQQ